MRTKYFLVIGLAWGLLGYSTGSAQTNSNNANMAYASSLREGMSIGDVVAALGEPQARIEMETKRETQLLYPKRALRFVEGRLVLSLPTTSVPPAGSTKASEKKESSNSTKAPIFVSHGNPEKSVKLESVLNEVMRTKPNASDTSAQPKVYPLMPGVPGGPMPGMPGMQGSVGMQGAPFGMPGNTVYNREDQDGPDGTDQN